MSALRKNVAGQNITFQLNSRVDGTPITAGASGNVTIDNGAQTAAAGTFTHKGSGQWNYAPTQAETNGTSIGLQFTATNSVNVNYQLFTTANDPTNATTAGIGNLDAAISTRSTYAGGAVASVTAAVTVGGYSAGEDPASLVLATPANKLATDVSGRVTAGTVSDKTGYSLTQTFPTNFSSLAITAGGAITAGTVSDKTGYALTAAEHTAITGDVWNGARASYVTAGSFGQGVASVQGNVTGSVASVTGSVGSVTGAVGSVTGAVGSVAGNVGGNVVGSVASVTGAVGSVTGNVGGSVASVTGAVGSVTGNVGGNVVGSIGSLAAQAKTDAFTAVWTTQLTESYAALHTVPTPAQLAFETRMLLAEKSVAGTTVTGKRIDGATPAETFALNDPASPTSISRAS